jgi:hypothetical protein
MDCPACGLVNPPTAQQCDCGYDFVERRQKQPLVPAGRSSKLSGWAKLGIVLIIYGLVFLGPALLTQTGPSPPESSSIQHVLGYVLGQLTVGLLVSALIAWPIIWLIDRRRKPRRAGSR